MKYFASIVIGSLFIISCGSGQQERKIIELLDYKDSVVKINKELSSSSVINLKKQYYEYCKAVMNGDNETVAKYIYKDLYERIKIKFPDRKQSIPEIMDKVLTNLNKKNQAFTYNQKAEVELYKLTKKHSDDNVIMYSFISLLHMKLHGDNLYNGEEVLAVSTDTGENWEFIVFTREEIPELLRMRYSENIINSVMKE